MDADKQPSDSHLINMQSTEDSLVGVQMESVRMRGTFIHPITTESLMDVTAALLPSGGTQSHPIARRTIVCESQPTQENEALPSMKRMGDEPDGFQPETSPENNFQREKLSNSTLMYCFGTSTQSPGTSDPLYDKAEAIHSLSDDKLHKMERDRSTCKTGQKVLSSVSVAQMPRYAIQPKSGINQDSLYEEVKEEIEKQEEFENITFLFEQNNVTPTTSEYNTVFNDVEHGKDEDKECAVPSDTSEDGGIDLENKHPWEEGISETDVDQKSNGEINLSIKLPTTVEIEEVQQTKEMSQSQLPVLSYNSRSLGCTSLSVGVNDEIGFPTNDKGEIFLPESQEQKWTPVPSLPLDKTKVCYNPKENEDLNLSLHQTTSDQIRDDGASCKSGYQPRQPITNTLDHANMGSRRLDNQSLLRTEKLCHSKKDHISEYKDPEPLATSIEVLVVGNTHERDVLESSETRAEILDGALKDWIRTNDTQESTRKSGQTGPMKRTTLDEIGKKTNVEAQPTMQHQISDHTSIEIVQKDDETDLYLPGEELLSLLIDTGQDIESLVCGINTDIGMSDEIKANYGTSTPGEALSTVNQRDGQKNTQSQENLELPGNQVTAIADEDVESIGCDGNSFLQHEVANAEGKSRDCQSLGTYATASFVHDRATCTTAVTIAPHVNLSIEEVYGNAIKEYGEMFLEERIKIYLDAEGHGYHLLDSGIVRSHEDKKIEDNAVLITMKNGSKLGMKNSPSNLFLIYQYRIHFYSTGQFGDYWFYAKDTITQLKLIMKKIPITFKSVKIVQNFLSLPDYPRLLVPYAVIYDRNGFLYFLMGHRNVLAMGKPPEGYHFNKLNLLVEELCFLKYCKKNGVIPENIEESILYTKMGVFFDSSSLSNYEDPCVFKKYIKEMIGLLLCEDLQERYDLELLTERAYECLEEDAAESSFGWLFD